MTLGEFADNRRLKIRRDECGDVIIPGRQGQIYEYSDTELGVMFMPMPTRDEPWGKWRPKTWGNFRRAAIAIDMILRQNATSEGCLSFDPANDEQAKLAIKIAGIRPKRKMSPEQMARQVRTLSKFRFQAKQEGTLAAQKRSEGVNRGNSPMRGAGE